MNILDEVVMNVEMADALKISRRSVVAEMTVIKDVAEMTVIKDERT